MIFNVLVGVIELVEADRPEDAIKDLSARVQKAGFETFSDNEGAEVLPHAFESEPLS